MVHWSSGLLLSFILNCSQQGTTPLLVRNREQTEWWIVEENEKGKVLHDGKAKEDPD